MEVWTRWLVMKVFFKCDGAFVMLSVRNIMITTQAYNASINENLLLTFVFMCVFMCLMHRWQEILNYKKLLIKQFCYAIA